MGHRYVMHRQAVRQLQAIRQRNLPASLGERCNANRGKPLAPADILAPVALFDGPPAGIDTSQTELRTECFANRLRVMFAHPLRVAIATVFAAAVVLSGAAGEAKCLTPPGDVNGSGSVNVADTQCLVLVNLWNLSGRLTPPPPCLTVELVDGDLNCDTFINVTDVQIAIFLALDKPLSPLIDGDGDKCPDYCEIDADGDGEPNNTDCSPFFPAVHPGAPETCNGLDDDCDGLRDELVGANAVACDDEDVCTGLETCDAPAIEQVLVITEIMIDPGAMGPGDDGHREWLEVFNPGTAPIDLRNWSLYVGSVGHIVTGSSPLTVRPGGFAVIASNLDPVGNGGVYGTYAWPALQLPNASGTLSLRRPDGSVADFIAYDVSLAWPIVEGASMYLSDAFTDNSVPSAWSASTIPWRPGQPGQIEPPIPPTPASDFGSPLAPHAAAPNLCGAGLPLVCNDGNPCTTDSCDPLLGCRFDDNTDPCDDSNACTTVDVCVDGACVGTTPVVCPAPTQCELSVVCAPLTGQCVTTPLPNGVPCSDGDACTVADACLAGTCIPGAPLVCNDNNVCTSDSCAAGACVFTAASGACAIPELCVVGACVAKSCIVPPNPCNDNNACTADSCDGAGTCINAPIGGPCSDGNSCTAPDTCAAGLCTPGIPVVCNDGEVCTVDVCIPIVGCLNVPNASACDDGEPCTESDACAGGVCVGGPVPSCNDQDACTDDFCVPGQGCAHSFNTAACSDGNLCTHSDLCAAGVCSGTPVACLDDSDVCTIDICDPATGTCGVPGPNGVVCDDGEECTFTDRCVAGVCQGVLHGPCADPAARVLCLLSGAANDVVDCEIRMTRRGMVTQAATGLQLGIQYPPSLELLELQDDEFCIIPELCFPYLIPESFSGLQSGHSISFAPPSIDDWTTGGTLLFVNFSDANVPMSDAWLDAEELVGDAFVVTLRFRLHQAYTVLDPAEVRATSVIAADPNALPLPTEVLNLLIVTCEDVEDCPSAACNPADPQACNDNNPCTNDSCLPGAGCVYLPNNQPCDDADLCTLLDACVGGQCVGTPVTCSDDGESCTLDTCNPTTGTCGTPVADGTPCNDGEACTLPDICTQGQCTSTEFPACLDPQARVLCLLVGEAGDLVDCPIQLIRSSPLAKVATGIQMTIDYPATAELESLQDGEICFVPTVCAPYTIPDPFTQLQSGHSLGLAPVELADWVGNGSLLFAHFSAPETPLTESLYSMPSVVTGDPVMVTLQFRLGQDFPAAQPAVVSASTLLLSDEFAAPIPSQLTNLIILVDP